MGIVEWLKIPVVATLVGVLVGSVATFITSVLLETWRMSKKRKALIKYLYMDAASIMAKARSVIDDPSVTLNESSVDLAPWNGVRLEASLLMSDRDLAALREFYDQAGEWNRAIQMTPMGAVETGLPDQEQVLRQAFEAIPAPGRNRHRSR